MSRISVYIISLLLACGLSSYAQENNEETPEPTVVADSLHKEKYGLRLGTDLFKLTRSAADENYRGFELQADYRVLRSIYLALELGNDQKTTVDDRLTSRGSGSYFKAGFDYNMHNNWAGLNNMIYMGLRYGAASFSQELHGYSIITEQAVFGEDIRTVNESYSGLNAHWAELMIGVKAEILNNLFLTFNLQLKRKMSEQQPDNFENLYIPGFNRTWEDSNTGIGFSYGIAYLIPLFKK